MKNSILRATHVYSSEEETRKLKNQRSKIYERLRKELQSSDEQEKQNRSEKVVEPSDQKSISK